jgi:hypothetical protein
MNNTKYLNDERQKKKLRGVTITTEKRVTKIIIIKDCGVTIAIDKQTKKID